MASFGIYGNTSPIIIVSGTTQVNLTNCVVQKDEPVWEYIEHSSIINGYRSIVRKGARWEIELIYYIYKAGTILQQYNLANTLQNLLWNDNWFYYYRHNNGDAYRDSNGWGVHFKLVEFKPFHLENSTYKDAVLLKIISLDYVKIVPVVSA